MKLIELKIETRGEVLSSNLAAFRESVMAALATVNLSPQTDEEFGQAELDVKVLKQAEAVVVEAKTQALVQAEDLQRLFAALDEVRWGVREARLELEKRVTEQKKKVRKDLIDEAKSRIECADHVRAKYGSLLSMSIKGKRTIASIREGLDKTVAQANQIIGENRKVIAEFEAEHGITLVPDKDNLETMSCDYVTGELRRRLEAYRADQERKRLEEEVKAAKAAEEAARKEAAEKDLPPAPPEPPSRPIFRGTVSKKETVGETAEQELAVFCGRVVDAFGGLRDARAGLKHQVNIKAAEAFARAVAVAFDVLKKGGAEQ